jgi:molybdenum cofactor cytidylyltransferase
MRKHWQKTTDTARSIAVVLLAAGEASRMGNDGPHKLLAEFGGVPLVRRSALIALESNAASVTVVTGHRQCDIEHALSGLSVHFVHNPSYRSGMAGSLAKGFLSDAVQNAQGTLVLLGDMPSLQTEDLNVLTDAFWNCDGNAIIRAVCGKQRGNPVILPAGLYRAVMALEGDVGARHLIEHSSLPVIDVDIGIAALHDVDTPEAVIAAGGQLTS